MELSVTETTFGPVKLLYLANCIKCLPSSVHFPGAVNSKFVTKLDFVRPDTHASIPTYRVMDSDGVIVDKERTPEDISAEEITSWYTNMLSGMP